MPAPDIDLYELANIWSTVIAAVIGLAVFALVAKLVLGQDLTFGFKLRLPRRATPAKPVAVQRPVMVTALDESDAEWNAMSGLVETRADRLRAIQALQTRAEQGIEAAEYALDRLLADCAAAMLNAEAGIQLQRLRATIAEAAGAPAASVAAAREPAAASIAA